MYIYTETPKKKKELTITKEKENCLPNNIKSQRMASIEPTEELNITVAVRCRGRNQREVNLRSPIVVSIPKVDPNDISQKPTITISTSPSIKSNIDSTTTTTTQLTSRLNKKGNDNNPIPNLDLDYNLSLQTTGKTYTFDHIFDPTTPQSSIFTTVAEPLLNELLKGYNCTALVYGMTASGKTYTMIGDETLYGESELSEESGLIPRVLVRLFERLAVGNNDADYVVRCSFLELYNESLRDLLADGGGGDHHDNDSSGGAGGTGNKVLRIYDSSINSSGLNMGMSTNMEKRRLDRRRRVVSDTPSSLRGIVRDKKVGNRSNLATEKESVVRSSSLHSNAHVHPGGSGIYVQNLKEFHITTARDGIQLLQRGLRLRQTAMTRMNDISSRSHTIFTISLYREHSNGELFRVSKMNLVDLAGSENIHKSGAINQRAKETCSINQSLLTLGRVINSLADHRSHIPFRESKLTRLLQDSLGGNTKTVLIATISPAKVNVEETLSTLEYATKAKDIKNKPKLGTIVTKDILLKSITLELAKVRSDLFATRDKDGIYMNQEHYKQLTSEIGNYKSEIEGLRQTIETLTRGNQSLVAERHRLSQTVESQTGEISSLRGHIELLETELNSKRKREDLLSKQLKDFSEAILTLNDEIQIFQRKEQTYSDKFRQMLEGELKYLKLDLSKNLERLEMMTKDPTFNINSEISSVREELNNTLQITNAQIHDVYSKCLENLFTEAPTVLTGISDKLLEIRESSEKFQAELAEKLSDMSEENNIFKQFLDKDFLKSETHDDLLNSHINKTTSMIRHAAVEMMEDFKKVLDAYIESSTNLVSDSLKNSTSDILLQESKNFKLRLSRWETSTELINKCDLLNNIHNNNVISGLVSASNGLKSSREMLVETVSRFNSIGNVVPMVDVDAVEKTLEKVCSKNGEIDSFLTDSLEVTKKSINRVKTLDDSLGTILKEIGHLDEHKEVLTPLGELPLNDNREVDNIPPIDSSVGYEKLSSEKIVTLTAGNSGESDLKGLKRHLEHVVKADGSNKENLPSPQQLKIPRLE